MYRLVCILATALTVRSESAQYSSSPILLQCIPRITLSVSYCSCNVERVTLKDVFLNKYFWSQERFPLCHCFSLTDSEGRSSSENLGSNDTTKCAENRTIANDDDDDSFDGEEEVDSDAEDGKSGGRVIYQDRSVVSPESIDLKMDTPTSSLPAVRYNLFM